MLYLYDRILLSDKRKDKTAYIQQDGWISEVYWLKEALNCSFFRGKKKRTVVVSGWMGINWEGAEGHFWGDGNILPFDILYQSTKSRSLNMGV